MISKEIIITPNMIKASEWVQRGSMIVQRYALNVDDKDSYFALWYAKYKEILPIEFQEQLYNERTSAEEEKEILEKLSRKKIQPLYLR